MMYQVIKHKIDPISTFGWYIKPKRQKKYYLLVLILFLVLIFFLFASLTNISKNKTYSQADENEVIARNL